jgi:hypothetical protein
MKMNLHREIIVLIPGGRKRGPIKLRIDNLTTKETNVLNATVNPNKKVVLAVGAFNSKEEPRDQDMVGDYIWTFDKPGFVALFPQNGGKTCEVAWVGEGVVIITADGTTKSGVELTDSVSVATLPVPVPVELTADHLKITIGPEVDL